MTVAELRKALEGVPDDFPVVSVADWSEFRAARIDSYLRALPPNVLVLVGERDFDMYEHVSHTHEGAIHTKNDYRASNSAVSNSPCRICGKPFTEHAVAKPFWPPETVDHLTERMHPEEDEQ